MQQQPEQKNKMPWVLLIKFMLTFVLVYLAFFYEILALFLVAINIGFARAFYVLTMLVPFFAIALVWMPKTKKFMLPLGGTFAVFALAGVTFLGIDAYNQSLIIDTTPAIVVDEYLPFREDSKIVRIRSKTVIFKENPPKIDGAAALFPVYSGFVNATYPENTVLDDDCFKYNNTPGGYKALAEKKTDVFIGVYPSAEQLEYAEECGTHFEFTEIGYDAFVFFVHKDNPIDSLTSEQISAIYAGEITNWKELGGGDEEIVAYQRNEGSGSQSMLIRFMGDKKPMTPDYKENVGGMGTIIKEVADYKSVTASIGFSFRFYVEGIIKNPDVKMIAIDGVLPTAENVRNESYPIRTPFYAVTYKENTNPNTDRLIEWILSEEGQYIIEQTGYVGAGK